MPNGSNNLDLGSIYGQQTGTQPLSGLNPVGVDSPNLTQPPSSQGSGQQSTLLNLLNQKAQQYGLDKYGITGQHLAAIIGQESGGSQGALSNKGAMGLMQIMPDTARGMGYDPNQVRTDPATNLDAGVRYFAQQMNSFKNWNLALAAYNAGPGAVQKYGNQIPPYKETQQYVNQINARLGQMGGQQGQPFDTSKIPLKDIPIQQPQAAQQNPSLGQDFVTGAKGGYYGALSLGGGLVGAAGQALGLDGVRQAGVDFMNKYDGISKQYQTSVPQIENIHDTSSFAHWLFGTLGNLAPTAAQSALAGIAGSVMGTEVPGVGNAIGAVAGALGKDGIAAAIKNYVAHEATGAAISEMDKQVGKAALQKYAASTAVALNSYGTGVGDTYQNQVQGAEKNGNTPSAGLSFALAAPYAALDAWPQIALATRTGIFKTIGKDVAQSATDHATGGLLKRVGTGALHQGAEEMVGEGGQEALNVVAQHNTDPNYNMTGPEAISRVLNSAAAGLAGGVVTGGAGGLGRPEHLSQPAIDVPNQNQGMPTRDLLNQDANGRRAAGMNIPAQHGPVMPGQFGPEPQWQNINQGPAQGPTMPGQLGPEPQWQNIEQEGQWHGAHIPANQPDFGLDILNHTLQQHERQQVQNTGPFPADPPGDMGPHRPGDFGPQMPMQHMNRPDFGVDVTNHMLQQQEANVGPQYTPTMDRPDFGADIVNHTMAQHELRQQQQMGPHLPADHYANARAGQPKVYGNGYSLNDADFHQRVAQRAYPNLNWHITQEPQAGLGQPKFSVVGYPEGKGPAAHLNALQADNNLYDHPQAPAGIALRQDNPYQGPHQPGAFGPEQPAHVIPADHPQLPKDGFPWERVPAKGMYGIEGYKTKQQAEAKFDRERYPETHYDMRTQPILEGDGTSEDKRWYIYARRRDRIVNPAHLNENTLKHGNASEFSQAIKEHAEDRKGSRKIAEALVAKQGGMGYWGSILKLAEMYERAKMPEKAAEFRKQWGRLSEKEVKRLKGIDVGNERTRVRREVDIATGKIDLEAERQEKVRQRQENEAHSQRLEQERLEREAKWQKEHEEAQKRLDQEEAERKQRQTEAKAKQDAEAQELRYTQVDDSLDKLNRDKENSDYLHDRVQSDAEINPHNLKEGDIVTGKDAYGKTFTGPIRRKHGQYASVEGNALLLKDLKPASAEEGTSQHGSRGANKFVTGPGKTTNEASVPGLTLERRDDNAANDGAYTYSPEGRNQDVMTLDLHNGEYTAKIYDHDSMEPKETKTGTYSEDAMQKRGTLAAEVQRVAREAFPAYAKEYPAQAETKPDKKTAKDLPKPPTYQYRTQEKGGSLRIMPPVGQRWSRDTLVSLRQWLKDAGYDHVNLEDKQLVVSETENSPPLHAIPDGVEEQKYERLVNKDQKVGDFKKGDLVTGTLNDGTKVTGPIKLISGNDVMVNGHIFGVADLQPAVEENSGNPENSDRGSSENSEKAPDHQTTVDEKAIEAAKQQVEDAWGDIGMFFTDLHAKKMLPDEHAKKLIPMLTHLMDGYMKLGYYSFKKMAKEIIEQARARLPKEDADSITLKHLQGAYIAMSSNHEGKADDIADVAGVKSLDEVMAHEEPAAEPAGEEKSAPNNENAEQLTISEESFREMADDYEDLFKDPEAKIITAHRVEGELLTQGEADKRIAEWQKRALELGRDGQNYNRTVLSLFDHSGAWSQPWVDAGYNVITFDIQDGQDIRDFDVEYFSNHYIPGDIHAILAACPCTDFASSGSRFWSEKDEDGRTEASIDLVRQTLATIEYFRPVVWALENPVGRIERLTSLPKARMTFDPHNFGDPLTKKTLLWGRFNAELPTANVAPTEGRLTDKRGGKSLETKNFRSETPEGFSYAFFMANNYHDMPLDQKLTAMYPNAKGAVKEAVKAGIPEDRIHKLMDDTYGNDDFEGAQDALREEVAKVKAQGGKEEAPAIQSEAKPASGKFEHENDPEYRSALNHLTGTDVGKIGEKKQYGAAVSRSIPRGGEQVKHYAQSISGNSKHGVRDHRGPFDSRDEAIKHATEILQDEFKLYKQEQADQEARQQEIAHLVEGKAAGNKGKSGDNFIVHDVEGDKRGFQLDRERVGEGATGQILEEVQIHKGTDRNFKAIYEPGYKIRMDRRYGDGHGSYEFEISKKDAGKYLKLLQEPGKAKQTKSDELKEKAAASRTLNGDYGVQEINDYNGPYVDENVDYPKSVAKTEFHKDAKGYLAALNKVLGWQPDTSSKSYGKTGISANWSGAAGSGEIQGRFWNGDKGVMIQVASGMRLPGIKSSSSGVYILYRTLERVGGKVKESGNKYAPWDISAGEFAEKIQKETGATSQAAPAPEAKPQTIGDKLKEQQAEKTAEPAKQIADWVQSKMEAGEKITWQDLFKQADEAHGGTQAEGKYNGKDAYDAMELGVNQYIAAHPGEFNPNASEDAARIIVARLKREMDNLPTQTKRTEEQQKFQQFSTPPTYSYVANWVANVKSADTYLEPSAGIGGLAVFGKNAGAHVVVNELSARRAAILKHMGFNRVFTENAEQLNNILPADVKPTVVVMNPPFSASAGRLSSNDTMIGAQHVEQALKRLAPGGRLVAIVGEGMAHDRPRFREWWKKIEGQYNVRANIGIDGKGYAKYGTTFSNQLLVIDKDGPTNAPVVTAKVDDIADAIPLLEGIRNDRNTTALEQNADQSGGKNSTETGAAGTRSDQSLPGATTGLGDGERGAESGSQTQAGSGGHAGSTEGGRPAAGNGVSDTNRSEGTGDHATNDAGSENAGRRSADAGRSNEQQNSQVEIQSKEADKDHSELTDSIFESYKPQKLHIPGAKPHPGPLVQSAAMATVEPPAPKYTPHLPKDVITEGKLSLAQLESVVYAGQAHQDFIDTVNFNGGSELSSLDHTTVKARKGFFIGDGTGVGKGREISGIILDNMMQGRKKAVWISEKQGLFKDAQRDYAGVGGDKDILFAHGKIKAGDKITQKDGILFTTYSTLRSGQKQTVNENSTTAAKRRIDQIVDWLGPDFDGVIAFDEAHNMANAVQKKGKRGKQDASAQALAGLELQQRLPKARVIYVSATGATEVSNLAYAERLGLWGPGTAFPTLAAFIGNIEGGGIGAMELVSRDMKQMGVYLARSLDYAGVTYSRLEHDLTPAQTAIYNRLAEAWQTVLQNVNEALEETGGSGNANAKSSAMSKFWGTHQRFFNQIITSLQMPSVLEQMGKDLAADKSIVVQLVNTNESSMKRALAGMEDESELEELDITPRDALIQFVQNAFPVQQFEEYEDENGQKGMRPVTDSEGNPVFNQEAIAMREQLLQDLRDISVPEGPLEMIINQFGPDAVAEVTGRKERVVRALDENGEMKTQRQKRGSNAASSDAADFQAGKKRILIFSDAGGTGFSFHADKTANNQQKRMHYLLQPGWRADKAVQGFGRTHRTNQDSAPHYYLVTTDLPAQKRFISSIARRLDQLGALTKGQRQAGSQGMFNAKDNLESQYAEDAVNQFFHDLYKNAIPGLEFGGITQKMGLDGMVDKHGGLNESKIPPVPQFLNRLLSLQKQDQEDVFNAFFTRMEQKIDYAIQQGTLDNGLENLKAEKTEKVSEEPVYTDPNTGAVTKYLKLELTHNTHMRSWDEISDMATRRGNDFKGFIQNKKTGKIFGVVKIGNMTNADGTLEARHALYGVTGANPIYGESVTKEKYQLVKDRDEAQRLWQEQYDKAPQSYTVPTHMITGAILPIWDRLLGNIRVVRALTDEGERFIGRVIPNVFLKRTLQNLGASPAAKLNVGQVYGKVMSEGRTATLANGWTLQRSLVSNNPRLEVKAGNISQNAINELKGYGAFHEQIQWKDRVFIPTGKQGEEVLSKLLERHPVSDITGMDEAPDAAQFRQTYQTGGNGVLSRKDIGLHLDRIVRDWTNAPAIHVVDTYADLPAAIRDAAEEGAEPGEKITVKGVHYRGQVYIVADQQSSMRDAETTLFHETFGHYGMRGLMGNKAIPILMRMFNTYRNHPVMKQILEHDYKFPVDADNLQDRQRARVRAADEFFAHMAEKLPAEVPTIFQRALDAIRNFFKRVGLFKNHQMDNAELLGMIADARRLVTDGPQGPGPKGGVKVAASRSFFDHAINERGLTHEKALAELEARGPEFQKWESLRRELDDAVAFRRSVQDNLREHLTDIMQSDKKVTWWDKSVGTMFNLAKRFPHTFGKVFNAGQDFINDTWRYAVNSEEHAPLWFKKGVLDTLNKEDAEAVGQYLYKGTLNDRLFSRDTLLQGVPQWGLAPLTETQADMYSQALDAINTSLDEAAKAFLGRAAKGAELTVNDHLGLEEMANQMILDLNERIREQQTFADSLRNDFPGDPRAIGQVTKLQQRIEADKQMIGFTKKLRDKNEGLKSRGYFPLMRYGTHYVSVTRNDEMTGENETGHFQLFEGSLKDGTAQMQANRAARALRESFPEEHGWQINTGLVSKQGFQLYDGLNMDALELFAQHLGMDNDPIFQEAYRTMFGQNSAMKRLIHRKGTPGFSMDAQRTLANFIMTSSRVISAARNTGEMLKAAEEIKDGDLKDMAVKLVDYLRNPKEEASAFRGLMFFHFLGGSISSALVNLTQLPMVAGPFLTKYGSIPAVMNQMRRAFSEAVMNKVGIDVRDAVSKAEHEGLLGSQEVWNLMGISRGAFVPQNKYAKGFLHAWGFMFGKMEEINRRSAFVAAYRMAKEKGMSDRLAFDAAKDCVEQTQFVYNRGNRPMWARGALGSTLFTFKQFSVNVLELLSRLPRQQQIYMAALLGLSAGIEGLPFAEDIENLLDTLLQRMGFAANSRKFLDTHLKDIFGDWVGSGLQHGFVSNIFGTDVSKRFGLGQLVPGSDMFVPTNHDPFKSFVQGWGGPAASMVINGLQGLQQFGQGNYLQAGETALPMAIANALKGGQQLATGEVRDSQGRFVSNVSSPEAIYKMIGFTPLDQAEASRGRMEKSMDVGIVANTRNGIIQDWAHGIMQHDQDQINDARQRLVDWNQEHPDMMIVVHPSSIIDTIKQSNMSADQRLDKRAPKTMRAAQTGK